MDSNKYDIYIQKGVRKISYKNNYDKHKIEYITEFINNNRNDNSYCIDSRGIDSFFYGFEVFAGYRIVEYNKDNAIDRYITLDELNNGYIKLFDFIMASKFIGREFIRTEPVITYYNTKEGTTKIIDNRYLKKEQYGYNDKHIVLYEKDNTFLVKYIYQNNECYGIVDCRYIQDGKYEFIGNVYEEYKDRNTIYLDIIKQIENHNKNNGISRIRKK